LIEKLAVTTYAIQDHGALNVEKIAKVATMTLYVITFVVLQIVAKANEDIVTT
jgi:hypothetical protein